MVAGARRQFVCNDDLRFAIDGRLRVIDGVTGPSLPSKQAALATALLMARVARLAWKGGGRPSH